MSVSEIQHDGSALQAIASAFVEARRDARALAAYPGEIPAGLDQSYAIQDLAIARTHDRIVGWKVGYIAPKLQARLGAERLCGPIFARNVWPAAPGASVHFPIIAGGFAAVEGEFVFRLSADAADGKTDWSGPEALGLAGALHIGVEIAGSPLAAINRLGPTVVASDFGNNAGLILGPEVENWRGIAPDRWTVETSIDGQTVGTGTGMSLPGGPGAALAFLLNALAGRGRPARAGDLISTGAVTGIHDIVPGQSARVHFGAFGDILCQAEMARPEPT